MSLITTWTINAFWLLVALLVSPVILWRCWRHGKYREGWSQKFFGRVPARTSTADCVWFHAVSVGEVLQLQTILSRVRAERPDCEFVISTTTSTGHAVAREKFPDDQVIYFPLDYSWAIRRTLTRIRPTAIVLVELELWPNFVRLVHAVGIPLALINGRISANSFRGYSRVSFVMERLLGRLHFAAMQSDTYADRIRSLGMSVDRVHVTGSIKFDGVQSDRNNPATNVLRNLLGIADNASVFVAGSTQDPEEACALDAYRKLQPNFPGLRLILVPRHKERFEEVATLVEESEFPLLRRSQATESEHTEGGRPVILLDTLGELGACWGLADFAFVGGSMGKRGGQNMIEPSAYGAAVMFGTNTSNFKQVVEMLLDANAAQVIADQQHMRTTLESWLVNPDNADSLGRRAREVVLAQQGAAGRTVSLLATLLGTSSRRRHAA